MDIGGGWRNFVSGMTSVKERQKEKDWVGSVIDVVLLYESFDKTMGSPPVKVVGVSQLAGVGLPSYLCHFSGCPPCVNCGHSSNSVVNLGPSVGYIPHAVRKPQAHFLSPTDGDLDVGVGFRGTRC